MNINEPYIQDEVIMKELINSMRGRLEYTLMNDFLSKYTLQKDLYALKGLLAALLRVELDNITNLEILNPIEPGEHITDKDCILDIKLEMNHNTIINIEFQATFQDFWTERSLVYMSRNINQLKEGESYRKLKPCIHIGVLSKDLFNKEDERYTGEYYSEYKILNTKTYSEYSSKFTIIVLSLKNIENASQEDKSGANSLYYWGKLFSAKSWEELKMLAKDNEHIKSFVGTVKQLTAEEKVVEACESRRRYLNDIASYEEEIVTQKSILESQGAMIESQEAKIESQEAKIESQEAKIESQEAKIESQEAKIASQAEEIIRLKKILEDTKKK